MHDAQKTDSLQDPAKLARPASPAGFAPRYTANVTNNVTKRILIVDDERTVVEMLTEFFKQFQHGHAYEVAVARDAWHNSETAGAMIDRLSILALKVFHMRAQTLRTDVPDSHVSQCAEKLQRLESQRRELGHCLDTLLSLAADGRAFWRVYRQFKMYNSPELNPYLYGRKR